MPILNVPLNTKQVFVKATTPGGCDIFMPVDSFDANVIKDKKLSLQTHLNEAYPVEFTEPPKQLA